MNFSWLSMFSWLDYTFIGLLVLGLVVGIIRAALKEGYLLSGFILSFLSSIVLSVPVTDWAGKYIKVIQGNYLYAFLFLFLVSFGILYWIMGLLLKNNRGKKKSAASRLTGGLFGILRGVLNSFGITWVLMLQTWITPEWLYSSTHTFYSPMAEYLLFFSSYYQ